jgi:hypothetical protein
MKLYIETSVPNMLFHNDAPDKQEMTKVFVGWLKVSAHELFVSDIVIQEIQRTKDERRLLLVKAVESFEAVQLPLTPEARALGEQYLSEAVLPARFRDDLFHVAIAVCHHMDMVVSWNMKHLANANKVARLNAVNRSQGRAMIRIHTPQEVMGL